MKKSRKVKRQLYLDDVPDDMTEEDLKMLFGKIGPVESVHIYDDGRPNYYAIITYVNREDSERVMKELDCSALNSIPFHLDLPNRNVDAIGDMMPRSLFVKNFARNWSGLTLHDVFQPYGEVKSCAVMVNALHMSLQYGYVEFVNQEELQKALTQLKDMKIDGKQVHFEPFQKPRSLGNTHKQHPATLPPPSRHLRIDFVRLLQCAEENCW